MAAPLPTADSHAALPTFADAKCWHCRCCRSRPAVSYAKPLATIKEMTKYIQIFIIFLTLFACGQKETEKKTSENVNEKPAELEQKTESEKEEKWTDSNGNVFIEKGNEISIIPAKYNKTGKTYKVFIYNETSDGIGIIENLKIKPNEFKVFNLKDTDTLKLDNGVKFMFGETYGLEIEDKKSQVSGLGGKYLDIYKVPDEAEWAFLIVPPGKGDG